MRRLCSVLALCLGLLAAGCAVSPDQPVTQASQSMSVSQARREVLHMKGIEWFPGTSIFSSSSNPPSIHRVTLTRTTLTVDRRSWRLQDLAPALSPAHMNDTPSYLALDTGMYLWTGYGPGGNTRAQRLADALLTLKAAAAPEALALEQQRFDAIVRQYREADPKPGVTEDMRRYEVQAEAAIQGKQFEQAAELYDKALEIAPWWPQAHFNRALLLESLEQYGLAVDEMQRYLALAPDAPNARAAQDKIYQWELKVPAEASALPAVGAK